MVVATEQDHNIIVATSLALDGKIGRDDDTQRLRHAVETGVCDDKMKTLAEIAVAYIRWAQDLKRQRDRLKRESLQVKWDRIAGKTGSTLGDGV